jgi:hypothetical protein
MLFFSFSTKSPALRSALGVIATAAMCLAALCFSRTASAQRVDVYAPPPPPPPYGYGPPPPPPPYGYGPPPRRYYYYDPYREAPYAFDLALDLEGAVPSNAPQVDGATISGGGGFKLRAGERIRLQRWLHITPEVGYGYTHLWAADDIGDSYDWQLNRFFVGGRLDFGRIVVPGIYAHVGYGWQTTDDPNVVNNAGLYYDVGGSLDFRFVPHLGLGVHLEYAEINMNDPISWVAFGAHGDVVF